MPTNEKQIAAYPHKANKPADSPTQAAGKVLFPGNKAICTVRVAPSKSLWGWFLRNRYPAPNKV